MDTAANFAVSPPKIPNLGCTPATTFSLLFSGGQSDNLKEIMKGCILAFSGFVNPLRGELRDKALEMGAKYRPDWTTDCTHLV